MKLTPAQTNGFLAKPDPAARVILVYGPDTGLVHERAAALAKFVAGDVNDPFRVTVLTAAQVSESPARLHDEMATQAWGGGRRLIHVPQASEAMASAVGSLTGDKIAGDNVLLIEAGDLDKRSKLRSLCENNAQAVAIACYVEEGAARHKIIQDILAAQGFNIPRDVLMLLTDILPPDRIALRSELDKLALYAHGQKNITMQDVQATLHDAGAAEIDDLIFAVASGNGGRAMQMLDRLFAEQTSVVAILRSGQRHFMRLQWARGQMDQGLSPGEAVKKLQPPVFWKHADSMATQLRRWPPAKIERALRRLHETEAAVKRTGAPDTTLCSQLLLNMSA